MKYHSTAQWITVLLVVPHLHFAKCQTTNNPPQFVAGSGDMTKFSLPENTQVGSPVYQLKGTDPEGSKITYSISGPAFSVDRNTGVVRLRQELDRETQNVVEVIISITDEGLMGAEPNTVSLRREIPIRDFNDNAPMFIGRPYRTNITESTAVRTLIEVRPPIIAIDKDEGLNAEIEFSCFDDGNTENDICSTFGVMAEKQSDGNYTAVITLLKPLDYEVRPTYILTIMARDNSRETRLTAYASLSIDVIDVQDQPPVFLNPPYSAAIEENSPEGTSVLSVSAVDGDSGNPRPIQLSIENDIFGHFVLKPVGTPAEGKAILMTTKNAIDRENPEILQNGGVYMFTIRASELEGGIVADSSTTQVTIVVTDVDDNQPEFNHPFFNISIPENLGLNMPLPGLSIFVDDLDMAANANYELKFKNVHNSDNVFAITPTKSQGRTPVVVRVLDPSRLDFDVEDESLKVFTFDIIAIVRRIEVDKTRVTVNLLDANDNAPIFDMSSYQLEVPENAKIGYKIGDINATDRDSGQYGMISYVLKGFGSDYFYTNAKSGGLYVKKPLDYETQFSYTLTIVAIDFGGQEANAHIHVNVVDMNDNAPEFESLEYTRTIREGSKDFEPQLFVRATDRDGSTQGGGSVRYAIESENTIPGNIFKIDELSGEITMQRPASAVDTERGEYDVTISATDNGDPPLSNTTRVLIRVGISGNQRPIFKGQYKGFGDLPVIGPPSYRVSIPENAPNASKVITITAHDPDGLDSLLRYRIIGANDNFLIDEETGVIIVSPHAHLDRDNNMDSFEIIVNAVDSGLPIPETATATVFVNIKDINDEPPTFPEPNYVGHVSERSDIGKEVLKVTAVDKDLNPKLEYSILLPVKAITKSGVRISPRSKYNANAAFRIHPQTGQIFVNGSLNHNQAAVVSLTVEARDLNAEIDPDNQVAYTEVTIYVQSNKDKNPVFLNKGWRTPQSGLTVFVKEEMPIDSTLFTILAEDPISKQPISSFQLLKSDDSGFFVLHDRTGEVILRKRLDYESLERTTFQMEVKANALDGQRSTTTKVNIVVENVNDNSPIFEQPVYNVNLMENKHYPEEVIMARATDKDAVLTERDELLGFHKISFSLYGENAGLFEIDNKTGRITIAPNQTIDHEKTSAIHLSVRAEDAPGKPTEAKQAIVDLFINILDVNDNPPEFTQKNYTAVIPENAPIDSLVVKLHATDPDDGLGGDVRYELLNEDTVNGLFKINFTNGEIRTRRPLTGKGRSDPYTIGVRALDDGAQIASGESLYTDTTVVLYIGDVSGNDGIPYFVRPAIGQPINVSEDATIGSPVFQIVANDPDSPASAAGFLSYRIVDAMLDSESFRIDSSTGLLTTLVPLDREKKDTYNIIVEVADNGDPQQSVTRVMKINVLDADDHEPRFERDIESVPLELSVPEELPVGSLVGNFTAIDEDIGDNGAIDYIFINGNEDGIFEIHRTNKSIAVITNNKRLDREQVDSYILTVKCFKNGRKAEIARGEYNKHDMSEIKIQINIEDVDDNLPIFEHSPSSLGIRKNVPIDTLIATTHATDVDPEALPIDYSIDNITFVPQFYKRSSKVPSSGLQTLFNLNNKTGELRTSGTFFDFVDGYFQIVLKANNSDNPKRYSTTTLKVFVIRDKSLLKFVFTKPASEIQNVIGEFQKKVHAKLKPLDLELHVLDTQVLSKSDFSLDFSATSSCFQMFKKGASLPLLQMQKLMDSEELKKELFDVYVEYGVSQVESCSLKKPMAAASLIASPGTWLVILAAFIGICAIIATCTAFCLAKRYRKQSKQPQSTRPPQEPYNVGVPAVFYSEPIYGPL